MTASIDQPKLQRQQQTSELTQRQRQESLSIDQLQIRAMASQVATGQMTVTTLATMLRWLSHVSIPDTTQTVSKNLSSYHRK